MAISPTVEGFRTAFRRPSLTLAEIMWRWVGGATGAALFVVEVFEYLDTLPVTNGELLFLRTRHPYLVGEAIAHILRGSLHRAAFASLFAAMMLGVLWIIAGSVGRIATVRGLLDYFRRDPRVLKSGERDVASDISATREDNESSWENNALPALLRLNFLRAALAVAGVFGFAGASILAGFASPAANPQPGLAFLLFLPLAALVALSWLALNWFLSLAGMFAVRDGEGVFGALTAAVALCRERTGRVFAVSIWTGLAHLVAFVAAITVASMPLGFAGIVPWRLILAAIVCAALIYFALADWLYMARLAGYVCIAEMPEALLSPLPPYPQPTVPAAGPPLQTTIDRDEPILSDVPMLPVET
ncbi:MAG: hypothetical protein DMG79_13295 [Acidobacteria bacterium]|nr:MAG: hypothetical protein DMG79_13295 [Acidobacteriota bacterium]